MNSFNFKRTSGNQVLAVIAHDLRYFEQAKNISPELKDVLSDDKLDISIKKQLLRQVFSGSIDNLSLNLIYLLLEENHLDSLELISSLISKLNKRQNEMIKAQVITPLPLEAAEEQALIDTLQSNFKQEVYLEKIVDSSLIGGAIIKIGDKLYDGSLKGQLQSLEGHLLFSDF